jgi:S-adenosylmethionine:tRNA ribosyltransferase-isomerase
MELSDFDYELPPSLIAQEPAASRDESRMLRVDRASGTLRDHVFADLPRSLRRGDVLVLNNTRVFPARLAGTSETGARVEIFLTARLSGSSWEALARPAKRLREGKRISFDSRLSGRIAKRKEGGRVEIDFEYEGSLDEVVDAVGKTPLPPYIERNANEESNTSDRERYQTVYAKHRGAIAAPTAGLHFTAGILKEIGAAGAEIAEVTLHVGYGTFEPVRALDLAQHSVLPERYEIDSPTAQVLNAARRDRRRIVAVGTTTTRALETAIAKNDEFVAGEGVADLTITPGYRFRAIDALLTNFHLPKSSLLILVSTFGGHKLIMDAYQHAVASRYRFYSYGDCMFVE